MINFDFSNKNIPVAGSLLISEPFMYDDYFTRSVVLLCEHNEEGSFGFVLNKYIESSAKDVLPELNEVELKISIGGPVDNSNLFYVHSIGKELENSVELCKDISIGGDFDQLKEHINKDPKEISKIRFFIGYSGWSKGQLQEEIDDKSWVVLNNVPTELILDTSNDSLWKSLMKELGGKFEVMSKFPVNPSDN